jgi:TctA family transporter
MWNLKLTLVLLAPFCVCLLVYCGLCAAYQVAPTYCEVAACLAFGLMGTLMTKEVER